MRSSPAAAAPFSRRSRPKASTGPSAPAPSTGCCAAQATNDAVKSYGLGPVRVTEDRTSPAGERASATTQLCPPETDPADGPGTTDATRSPTNCMVEVANGTRRTTEPTSEPA